jgi:glycosyltransferase involved in cell wall biosynthesis
MKPLISVITPTWLRHGLLLERCIPSVQAQTWHNVEHVIVSDGPDPELRGKLAAIAGKRFAPVIRYAELPEHDPAEHWGSWCRAKALELADGEFITYCDDDDQLYARHCEVMGDLLESDTDLDWAYSEMLSHGPAADIIIAGPPAEGLIGTPMIMHRLGVLKIASWGKPSRIEDWELVREWIDAGTSFLGAGQVTSEVWPSAYR